MMNETLVARIIHSAYDGVNLILTALRFAWQIERKKKQRGGIGRIKRRRVGEREGEKEL